MTMTEGYLILVIVVLVSIILAIWTSKMCLTTQERMMPPCPPMTTSRVPLSLCGNDWNLIRKKLKSDMMEVTSFDKIANIPAIMYAIDLAYACGREDREQEILNQKRSSTH